MSCVVPAGGGQLPSLRSHTAAHPAESVGLSVSTSLVPLGGCRTRDRADVADCGLLEPEREET